MPPTSVATMTEPIIDLTKSDDEVTIVGKSGPIDSDKPPVTTRRGLRGGSKHRDSKNASNSGQAEVSRVVRLARHTFTNCPR